MPKSRRAKVVHVTQVGKKGKEHKEKQFASVQAAVSEYQHCFVFAIENNRTTHLQELRQELSDSKFFFGKTKLTVRALGQTPEEAHAPGVDALTPYIKGQVGLLFTNREPEGVMSVLAAQTGADFARAGTIAPRGFVIPAGVVYSTGGEVPAEHDVPMQHSIEPELRRLGMPTRLVRGKVLLGEESGEGEGYTVCKEGDVLESRQTRLLKLFSVCMSDFKIQVLAYWTAGTGSVTEVNRGSMDVDE